jgi:hypothetical protein
VAAAVTTYAQASHTYKLTGSANGVNFTAALTFTPGASATFENQMTSTGWLCEKVTGTPAGGGSATNSSQCYWVGASGNVLALKIVVQVNGQSVTIQ